MDPKAKYLKNRAALMNEAETFLNAGDLDKYEAKTKEIETLDANWEKTKVALANFAAMQGPVNPQTDVLENTSLKGETEEDPKNTMEYRKAFMNFCQTGETSPLFTNADEFTTTTDAGAVIPTTILEEVIEQMKVRGNVFNRVRMTSIKGGVEVPISAVKPVATWIGQGAPSDRQKVDMSGNVSFNYYGLECRVAVSLVASATTLMIFETTIVALIVEAMLKALDIAVIKGTGTGQPLGITVDTRIPAANDITLAAADFITWEGWKKKVFAKIPLAYRAGGVFTMAAGTFEGYIDGMVDANGQPMARVNYGIADGSQERFGGKEVILVEDDVITPYEAAVVDGDDIVAIFCRYSDYAINSNMTLTMYRWLDHETNQWVDKAMLIADGKILDPNGVLIIRKGA